MIAIQCYDYSEQAGDVNHLAVSLNSCLLFGYPHKLIIDNS